jgi:hypothetical protein
MEKHSSFFRNRVRDEGNNIYYKENVIKLYFVMIDVAANKLEHLPLARFSA